MGPITSIVPVPRRCPIGGESVMVSEFRLRDIADLQAILDEEWADPIEDVPLVLPPDPAPQDAAAGDKERFLRLVPLYERAESGPPAYGTAAGNAYFATPEGGACLLWVAGRRHTPGLDPATAAKLYVEATPDEFARVWRIAHGVASLKAIEGMLWSCLPGGHGDAPDHGKPATWAEMIDELARARQWTYEDVYNLTLSEWIYARNGGKVPETTRRAGPGQDAAALARLQREWWSEARESGERAATIVGGQGENPPC